MSTTAPSEQALGLVRVRALAKSGRAREIRHASGLNLWEVADAIGTSATSIQRWETSAQSPHGPVALRYLAFLDSLARLADAGS